MKNKRLIICTLCVLLFSVSCFFTITKLNSKKMHYDTETTVSRNYEIVNDGEEKIDGTDFVTFDAFYLRDLDGDGYAERIRGSCKEIGQSDTLYMDLNVLTNGTLKDAKIEIKGNNFYFSTALVKDSVISKDYISNNTKEIILNDVQNGTQKLIFGITKSGDYSSNDTIATAIGSNVNNYSSTENSVTLTGIHVSDSGEETEISKTVYLTNDWYGRTKSELSTSTQRKNIEDAVDNTNSNVNIDLNIKTSETERKLLLDNQHIEIQVPQLNGYDAIEVKIDDESAIFSFDKENQEIIIDTYSKVFENGFVGSKLARDLEYNVTVTYPQEAYSSLDEKIISLNFPVNIYYTGYNNPKDEFENPYKSNVSEGIITVVYSKYSDQGFYETTIGASVGKSIDGSYIVSKALPINVYNGVESIQEDNYEVRWSVFADDDVKDKELVIRDDPDTYGDKFIDANNNYIDMTNYESNNGIYFIGLDKVFSQNGYVKVFNDDTNELLHTFNEAEWNIYNDVYPFKYDSPVKHVRVETSKVVDTASFYIYHVKEIDDVKLTTDFTKAEFDNLSYIHTEAGLYVDNSNIATGLANARYYEPYSEANIVIDPDSITNQETKKNMKMTISTTSSVGIKSQWKNGTFIIKYPQEIAGVNINEITSKYDSVAIDGVQTYKENGNIYTKIYVSSEYLTDINFVIDEDITADPRMPTITRDIELYYYNDICDNYINNTDDVVDINGNNNLTEKVGIASTTIDLIAPSNLLTSEDITEFDENGSIVFAPNYAEIDKGEDKTAKIDVNITNNYSNTISEVKIVGKIPYKGNKYQINGSDMQSEFDTTITNEGINVPDELKPYAKVYYSVNEEVTEDILSRKNNWTTTPEDMSKVKSYMIDLGDFVMPINNSYTFSYKVNVPATANYNEVAYSDHAVYYSLDTDEGKYNTQTEPNKVGIRIAHKFDLVIEKYQKNTERLVSDTVFLAKDDYDGQTSTIGSTGASGIATLKDLYVEKEYSISEIKSNSNYVSNNNEIKIIGHVNDGKLEIEILKGNFDSNVTIENKENENDIVRTRIENEVKYDVELDKLESITNETIYGIRFQLKDFNGKTQTYTTNKFGKISLKSLIPDKQYELTEIDTKGHYLKDPIRFIMTRDREENLQFNVVSGQFDNNAIVDTTDEVPVVRTILSNDKIPTYTLKITKKETGTENTIKGTQFIIEGENKNSTSVYESNSDGVINIGDLYQYVNGKEIIGEYTLTEIYPGEGYVLNSEPIKFKLINDNGNYSFDLISGTIRESVDEISVDTTNIDNPVVNITIDNEAIFSLTKVDEETGEPIEGVGFDIRTSDDKPVIDSNGNYIMYITGDPIVFTTSGDYPWTEIEDGVWKSGNRDEEYSSSELISEEFEIEEESTLTFEACVADEPETRYLDFTIYDSQTGDYVLGNGITGSGKVEDYDSLEYTQFSFPIGPGKYVLNINDFKNVDETEGLSASFVKNVKVIKRGGDLYTDSNGKINLSLREGIYRLIETSTLEQYELPEEAIEFGIGKTKPAEYGLDLVNKVESDEYKYLTDVLYLDDGFMTFETKEPNILVVSKYTDNADMIWSKDITVNVQDSEEEYFEFYGKAFKLNNGKIFFTSNYGQIILNLEGELIDYKYGLEFNTVEEELIELDDGIVTFNYDSAIKYDFDGNIIWVKPLSNSYRNIAKANDKIIMTLISNDNAFDIYDFDGNLIKSSTLSQHTVYNHVFAKDDSILFIYNLNEFYEFDYDGNLIETHNLTFNVDETIDPDDLIYIDNDMIFTGYSFYIGSGDFRMARLDPEYNLIWESIPYSRYNFGVYATHIYSGKVGENILCIIVGESGNCFVKYDLNGNLVSENKLLSYSRYTDIELGEDGFYVLDDDGFSLKKYDYDYNLIWQVNSNGNAFKNILLYDDGIFVCNDNMFAKYNFNSELLWEYSTTECLRNIHGTERNIYCDGAFPQSISNNKVLFKILGYESLAYSNRNYVADIIEIDSEGNSNRLFSNSNNSDYYTYSDWTELNRVGDDFYLSNNGSSYYGILEKLDFEGNTIWNCKSDSFENGSQSEYLDVEVVSDGIIAYGYDRWAYPDKREVIKIDFDGNLIWKYEFDGNGDLGYSDYPEKFADVEEFGDSILVATVDGRLYKLNSDGEKVWENIDETNVYSDIAVKDNKIFATTTNGKILEYRLGEISKAEIPSVTSLIVKNKIKTFKVTTHVNGIGGTISGMDEEPYETVKYKEDSIKDIIITPDEGYSINTITINGESVRFDDTKGYVELDKFVEMIEDKEVIVSFIPTAQMMIINKVDKFDNTPLANAKFNVKQIIDDSIVLPQINLSDVTSCGSEYYIINQAQDYSDIVGEKVDKSDYYFVENESGAYVSNNKGYKTTANSYFEIDLTDKVGKYAIVVNASVSSYSSSSRYGNFGYATITKTTEFPPQSSSTGRFVNIKGQVAAKDYITYIDGGSKYYLHLGYYKDYSRSSGTDNFTVNSINVYGTTTLKYGFVLDQDGGLESNNSGINLSSANGYIPIDLTNYPGKYNLILNAYLTSGTSSNDYGFAGIGYSTLPLKYNSSNNFMVLSGYTSDDKVPKDYSTTLEGGRLYYLHLGYSKGNYGGYLDDKLVINSIRLETNTDDFVEFEVQTDSNGQAKFELKEGLYKIAEIEAPEGYKLNTELQNYRYVNGQDNEITFEDVPCEKVIVHHYIKDTDTKVADDETIIGKAEEEYTTSPKTDLKEYELIKDENQNYIIPDNASGLFSEETQEVIYYYELKPVKLIVHHYIIGTEDKVAPDEISYDSIGEEYNTSCVEYPELDSRYSLVETRLPENASGNLTQPVTEVTYLYETKKYNITTEVKGTGGTITGEQEKPYEQVLYKEDSIKDIVVIPNPGYRIKSITINDVEQEVPENIENGYLLEKFIDMEEDKHIIVEFEIITSDINVEKIWNDNNDAKSKRPDSIIIELYNGSNIVKTEEINEEKEWKAVFKNCPLFNENGELITYSVKEKEKNSNDLELYNSNITTSDGIDFRIENYFEIPDETKNITVNKVWEDNNDEKQKRPSQIKIVLKAGEEIIKEEILDVIGESQSYTFEELPIYNLDTGDYINYSVDEVEVNDNDLEFYSKEIIQPLNSNIVTIKNKYTVPDEKIEIDVTKKWIDESNEKNTRPNQICIQVKNGEDVIQEMIVNTTDDEKTYTFRGLQKYDNNGDEIEYTVNEVEVRDGELNAYKSQVEGNTITNILKEHNITTEVIGEGGTISGNKEEPYESVYHKFDSIKDITIIPSEGHKIKSITINGIEQELPDDLTAEYSLEKFERVIEDKHVVVEFEPINYVITTEVDGLGGTISGQGSTKQNPFEVVPYANDSIEDILVKPDVGYRISSITINGSEIEFSANEDGTYLLNKFENMKEDKHIIVKFETIESSIIIKHQNEEGEDLVEPSVVIGKYGDKYLTEAKTFDEYEIKTIPDNYAGEMKEYQIEIIYIYSKYKGSITITKTDSINTELKLSGAIFKMEKLDKEGNIDTNYASKTGETNSEGKIIFDNLEIGKYVITEIKAPNGYSTNDEIITIEINSQNRNIELNYKNEIIESNIPIDNIEDNSIIDLPATGDINFGVMISIFALSITIVISHTIVNRQKKEN